MAYASADDVAALAARELNDEEEAMVNRRLEQAERMILRRVPDLHDRVASGDISEEDVRDVEAEAVWRVLRNPEGLSMETDGAYSYQRSREAADGSLRITGEEWRLLGVRVGSMFTIDPSVVQPRTVPSFLNGG